MRPSHLVRGGAAAFVLVALGVAAACDDSSSCPSTSKSCDPAIDGTPFDLLRWCQASGACLRDGMTVPVCDDADADPPPACALAPYKTSETLTFPISQLSSTLAGRRDLVVTYSPCQDRDAAPPDVTDMQVLYDGVPATCEAANPCDPAEAPTVMTCAGVPSGVQNLTVSFSYDGADGRTSLDVLMQDTSCSYFCE